MASKLTPALPAPYSEFRDQIVQIYQHFRVEQKDPKEKLHYSDENLIYRLVKDACYELGFIEDDAELIGKAWRDSSPTIDTFHINQWPTNPTQFGIRGYNPMDSFPSCPKNLGLYVIAPNAQWVEKLLKAGVQTVQIRFKSDNLDEIRQQVKIATQISKDFPCHLFINDYWQLALEYEAYGVHLGQEDIHSADFALIKKHQLRLGISTHGINEMLRADQISPSYIAIGAIYPTTLKVMPTAPQGIHRLALYAKLMSSYPLVGIGGVDSNNLHAVLQAQVGSVAMVRSVINAPDYEQAIRILQAKINEYRSH